MCRHAGRVSWFLLCNASTLYKRTSYTLLFITMHRRICARSEGGKRDITEISYMFDFGVESYGETGADCVDDAVLEGEYVGAGGVAVGVYNYEGLGGP